MSKYNNLTKEDLIKYIEELEKQLKSTKYGLYWDKSIEKEIVEIELMDSIPFLNKVDELTIADNGLDNVLIEGDNLHALTLLNMINPINGLVDVIYIDPPYNTCNKDFAYNDKFVDVEDGYRHSKWLSFMEKRLRLARELLKEHGVIFISIDDNEYANLRLLCDAIFGERNYLTTFIRKTKSMTGDDGNGLNIQQEYLLVYAKIKVKVKFVGEQKNFESFSNPDNDPNGPWCNADPSAKSGGESTYFPIVNPITGQIDYPPKGRYWAFSKETFHKYIESGRIKFKDKIVKNQRGFIFKRYAEMMESKTHPVDTLVFTTNEYMNSVATIDINNILNDVKFNYPKPTSFIKKLIKYSTNEKSIILDFFAGSGTTGQAVLELNKEDGGYRRFILCTNNENNICTDVTYPRLKTVITGVRPDGSKYSDGLPGSLHYYKCDFIPRISNTDQAKYSLVEKVNHLLCILENTFELVEKKDKFYIYQNSIISKRLFMYIDYFDEMSFKEFKNHIKNSNAKSNIVYMFSTDNVIDETLFFDLPGIELKAIPTKIYEIYREITEDMKRW